MSGAGSPDFFYREALRLGYVARSAFKMQKQYKLITPGASVLDLGCAPGAWLQVACQGLGSVDKGGLVVGIDIKKVKVPSLYCDSRVKTACADVMTLSKAQLQALSPQGRGFSVILSDMCPPVSGIPSKDSALSCELGFRAASLAIGDVDPDNASLSGGGMLRDGGNLVVKLLESEDTREFAMFCKPMFKKMSWTRPKATRPSSREIYLVCQGFQSFSAKGVHGWKQGVKTKWPSKFQLKSPSHLQISSFEYGSILGVHFFSKHDC
ncbi:ftsJ-like methyltransferase family protein isoform X2 [Wolffia australiana]